MTRSGEISSGKIFRLTFRRRASRALLRRHGRRATWCRHSDRDRRHRGARLVNTFLPSGRRAGLAGETSCVPPSPSATETTKVKAEFLATACLDLPCNGFPSNFGFFKPSVKIVCPFSRNFPVYQV